MKPLAIVFAALFTISAAAQKRPLAYLPPADWPTITSTAISGDGKYVKYLVGSPEEDVKLVIQAVDLPRKREIRGVYQEGLFTEDSRWMIFMKTADSLGILDLKNDTLQYITRVRSFRSGGEPDRCRLVYQLNDSLKSTVIVDLNKNEQKVFYNVDSYTLSADGKVLIIQKSDLKGSPVNASSMSWIDLDKGRTFNIGSGYQPFNLTFARESTSIAFFVRDHRNQNIEALLYYKPGIDSAERLVDASTPGMAGMNLLGRDISFSREGDKLFFAIEKKHDPSNMKGVDTLAHVDIWNYKDDDSALQFRNGNGPFDAVFYINKRTPVLQIRQINDGARSLADGANGDYMLFESNSFGKLAEYKWRLTARPDLYLVSTRDGERTLIRKKLIGHGEFSAAGKYVIWYDREQKNWFTYNIKDRITRNITDGITTPLYFDEDHPTLPAAYDIAGWMENDEAVFIYDRYDIWQVDPSGKSMPVNITQKYGIKNKTQLRRIDFSGIGAPIHCNDTMILSAFNYLNKQSGFIQLILNKTVHLRKLTMESKVYYFPTPHAYPIFNDQFEPVKAKRANKYMVRPMSATEYPNLCITADFVRFTPLTNYSPQNRYNWYTSEIVHWKLPDGQGAEGILYKPENFDPNKKYPLIFYYYERNASCLNMFIKPGLSNGAINIPWFVSNGYLVFIPDIYFKDGHPGRSALNSVVSAAQYLSKFPWVNAKHMGLQGHSFGGFETDFIVSHTDLFAAAAPAAGTTDLISVYNRLNNRDRGQWFYETEQGRIGPTLWQRPDLYIENSAVFSADRVSTPILIMHNKDDGVVLFDQEAEWYSALNRLGKKVWMLSYDGEQHTIDNEKNQLDYSIRLAQFFDHYLKGAPAPKWMTRIINPRLKGIESGLELETTGKKP